MKILAWERNGFWLLLKRLEQDRFIWPSVEAVPALAVEQLHWLLEGIDIGVVQRHPRRLYRQAAILGRFGGTDLSRNTLAAGVVRVGQAVQPVLNLLRDALLDPAVVHGDETEVQVLKEPGGKAQAKSYMSVQMTLYKVEADARRDGLDAQALQQQRELYSVPVLVQTRALALQHLHGVLPGSLLGKALHYHTAQWPKLVRYVDDGR